MIEYFAGLLSGFLIGSIVVFFLLKWQKGVYLKIINRHGETIAGIADKALNIIEEVKK